MKKSSSSVSCFLEKEPVDQEKEPQVAKLMTEHTPAHVHVRVFMAGACNGRLTFTREEWKKFKDVWIEGNGGEIYRKEPVDA